MEVALALGIFAFAIIPVIGMMGTGLNVSRESVESTTWSQIYRQVQSMDLAALGDTSLYFSNNGEKTSGPSDPATVYRVSLTAASPDDAAKGLVTRRLVQVKIAKSAAPSQLLSQRFLQSSMDPAAL